MPDVKHFESLYPIDSREKELSEIVRFIKEGNSAQIIGLPGVGRSNILGLLAHNREVRQKHFPTKNSFVHFVFVNFSELHSRPLIDTTKLLFLNLVDSLRERDMREEYAVANEILRESLQIQDEFVIFQGLKRVVEYLAIEKKLTLIFLFDRFEEYIPMLGHAFFSNLRILRNIAKYRFSVIFTLYKPLEDILEPSLLADFHELVAGHVVYLARYDEPSLTFRLSYLEQLTGKKLDGATRGEMLRLTGGHWKLTRLSAEALLAAEPSVIPGGNALSGISPEAPLRDAMETFLLQQKTIAGALTEILSFFTPVERRALVSLIRKDRTSWKNQDVEVKAHFEKLELVENNELTIPLLAAYLNTHDQDLKDQDKIVFDQERNVIRKGETILSDGLTAAEYRLLSYLIAHPERVIDREEVISVVWQEGKTTAGVTDQAVDQLIFRIRRKIEENPNQPTHLITVKGRGFSFSP